MEVFETEVCKSRIAVIIVTYNRKQILHDCIKAVFASEHTDFDIFVIDNASTDGTEKMMAAFSDRENLYYKNTGSNLGGAGGFHYGIKEAGLERYKYFWLMDDDTIVRANTMQKMFSYMELHPDMAWSTGKVLWKDGNICAMNVPKITKWRSVKNFERRQKVQYASFVALMIRVDVVMQVGLPYREFFIWGDDWEYTRRISKRYPCVYLPEAVSVHQSPDNHGSDIARCSQERLPRYSYMYRNEVVIYRQDGIEGLCYLGLRILLHTFRVLFRCPDGKLLRLKLIYSALGKGISFRPQIQLVEQEKAF